MTQTDKALDYLDLQTWLEQYVETKTFGTELRIRECPVCGNDKWKLYVNLEKKLWFCQRCTWGKNSRDVCILMSKVSNRHINDIRLELAKFVIPSQRTDEWIASMSFPEPIEEAENAPFTPVDLPGELGLAGITGGLARKYLIGRGLDDSDIEKYKIRLATKLRNIDGPWATFPVLYYSIPIGFQGRKFSGTSEPRYISSDKIHKWVWPLDTDTINRIEADGEVTVVEGIFDAISYIKLGINALCTFGKNFSRDQIKLLQTHKVHTINLCYDADAHKDIQKIADMYGHIFHIKVIELPPLPEDPKADPADVMKGTAPKEWLLDAHKDSFSTRDPEYWHWKLRKELGI